MKFRLAVPAILLVLFGLPSGAALVQSWPTKPVRNLTHVPYKGAGPLMPALLGGEVDLAFDGMGTLQNGARW